MQKYFCVTPELLAREKFLTQSVCYGSVSAVDTAGNLQISRCTVTSGVSKCYSRMTLLGFHHLHLHLNPYHCRRCLHELWRVHGALVRICLLLNLIIFFDLAYIFRTAGTCICCVVISLQRVQKQPVCLSLSFIDINLTARLSSDS
jgi:hypothetical protein